jgi:hypothetical protein
MRRFVYLLLLLCLPLYGFAMQGGLPQAHGGASLAHQVAHEEGIHHHHHEHDGSIHYDDSDESLAHVQEHSCAQPITFSVPSLTVPAERQAIAAAPFSARPVPDPFLDGPRKPPRFAPGHAAGGMAHA